MKAVDDQSKNKSKRMKLWPTRTQFASWSLPSKWGIIGGVVGVIALLFAIYTHLIPSDQQYALENVQIELGDLKKSVEDEGILGRIKDVPISIMFVRGRFYQVEPDEISLLILGNNINPFRIDFSREAIFLDIEGYKGHRTPLTPSAIEIYSELGFFAYPIDLKHLRTVDPTHPLSNLTLEKLDNATVRLLIKNEVRQKLIGTDQEKYFDFWISTQVSGYDVSLFNNIELKNTYDWEAILPRPILQRQGFVMMIHPEWNMRFEDVKESEINFERTEQTVDYAELKQHNELWAEIWSDEKTKEYFSIKFGFPQNVNQISFHPHNNHFVRVRDRLESSAEVTVKGIAAFQMYKGSEQFPTHSIFTRMEYHGSDDTHHTFEYRAKTITLSSHEIGIILNLLGEVFKMNESWVKTEGNPLTSLYVLLPGHNRYIELNPQLYNDYQQTNPFDRNKPYWDQALGFFKYSLTEINDLPLIQQKPS